MCSAERLLNGRGGRRVREDEPQIALPLRQRNQLRIRLRRNLQIDDIGNPACVVFALDTSVDASTVLPLSVDADRG